MQTILNDANYSINVMFNFFQKSATIVVEYLASFFVVKITDLLLLS